MARKGIVKDEVKEEGSEVKCVFVLRAPLSHSECVEYMLEIGTRVVTLYKSTPERK